MGRIWVLGLTLTAVAVVLPAKAQEEEEKGKGGMTAGTFSGLKLRSIGPAFMSGRIADIAIHPNDQSTWFVAVGSGGVWKTTNAGTTWSPIFDGEGSYSIGCITLDPSNPDVVWVGTGENVGGRHVGFGDGVYKSTDGGKSWKNMGLKDSQHIGNIVIDPRDSNVVFVAAQGPLWSAGGERGLFKSTDGGLTWKNVLKKGEYTGVNEVVLDRKNPDVLYAATHQRFRTVAALINGGPESGIHKSIDGGETWTELKGGIAGEDKGKIGLAISPHDSKIIYAAIELPERKGGFYRSDNAGASWEKRSDYVSGGTGPHYYQEIFACPHVLDRVYHMDVTMAVSDDGGKNFRSVGADAKHSDDHALAFDLHDPDYLLSGCDGGLYESFDRGESWKFISNFPVTQFYKVAVDYDEPFYNVVGGTQDNATQHGPSRTDNLHGIRNSDWMITVFGDGHQPAIDPTNANIIYSESQNGNIVRHDRKTGEITDIKPIPADGEENDRFNWDSPILISAHDPARIFFASQRVWRSEDRGNSWKPISGDLSRGQDRLRMPLMGRVWSIDASWDLYAMSQYGTVTSISESPLDDKIFYAGTDDGLYQVTEDGGQTWRKSERLPGVPEYFFVNDIKADLHDANTVYICVDNHKAGDFKPYVLKSTDRGQTWVSIAGDLPERHIVWRLVQDHENPNLLFVGTEFGVFFTINGGEKWIKLTGDVPTIPFRDLAIQKRENDLVGATFGRGFYILDDYTPLRHITDSVLEQEAELFPVRKAWWYIQRAPMGFGSKAFQGSSFFVAPNPPFGATFTYYLKESLETKKDQRRSQEKKIVKKGGDTPMPGWDALREEELELDPAIVLTIKDDDGEIVRQITGPARKGIHRVTWSLTYPSTEAQMGGGEGEGRRRRFGDPNDGGLVSPGTYSVALAKRVDGKLIDLGKSQTFDVVPLRDGGTLPGMTPQERGEFERDYAEASRQFSGARAVLRETKSRVEAIRRALDRSTVDEAALRETARDLELRLAALEQDLSGNDRRGMFNDEGPVSISDRFGKAGSGLRRTLAGPTQTHLTSYKIAKRQFTEFREKLHKIASEELPALEVRLEEARIPWTPGRPIPGE